MCFFCIRVILCFNSETRTCEETEFQCTGTGRCIPKAWVCDGDNDCGGEDPADESAKQGCGMYNKNFLTIARKNEFFLAKI